MPATRQPLPRQLPLVPPPPITDADVLEEIERMRLARAYWRRRYRSLDQLLADQALARTLWICARRALHVRREAALR